MSDPASTDPLDARVCPSIGPFRLIRRLGSGGMGVVYLAEQASPARRVALKLVRPDQLWSGGYRERFTREVEAAGRLAHPGIAPVYEMGEHDGMPWFSQEYVAGAPLSDLLAVAATDAPQRLTGADLRAALEGELGHEPDGLQWNDDFFRGSWVDVCLRIARQVAEALQHAHERGVLHRDVKPSNILLTPGGRTVLVDFGLASLKGGQRLTESDAQLGSLHYMAPEQLAGKSSASGARLDVYSLGVTLYELVTLRTPFAKESAHQLRGLILAGDAPPARTVNPSVSRDADVVIHCAIEPSPSRRYASAAAFAADIAAVQSHRPIAAQPSGPLRNLARWSRRRPALATALASALVLFVAVPIAFGFRAHFVAEREAELHSRLQRTLHERNELLNAILAGFRGAVTAMTDDGLPELPEVDAKRLAVASMAAEILERVERAHPEHLGLRREQELLQHVLRDLPREADNVER